MKTPLETLDILSIYLNKKHKQDALPPRMAKCTPDTHANITAIDNELRKAGGQLVLSDLFRSYEMQLESHNDYVAKRKTAFSPGPGGSLHEAGRAMDIDLKSTNIKLKDFWDIASANGFYPIIDTPDPSLDEAWHFDCRGSHQVVYNYYKARKGTNFKPYTAMAASAILAIDVKVDFFGANQKQAQLQAGLVRLGNDIGDIDGQLGKKTRKVLSDVGVAFNEKDVDAMLLEVEALLESAFPQEYLVLV